ncbi:competence protein CoiA family protein [Nocardioides sp. GCM10027113]|uniref:competence protein CoiA family protein n=1 Tax=unclassified Nocardioides TaxID=2615069 RepID=UPI0036171104
MTARRHDPLVLKEFLTDDPRQVWARDQNGAPVYIEVGTADEVREQAKAEWSCIVPDCTAPITTSGGMRRDHFKHYGTSPHGSGGESQNHLAAKAMLAAWATARLPQGASVHEEHTVKDPATAMHRIADVMVTWAPGQQTAFEVEYKPYAVADWDKKDDEYRNKGIPCVWLLGHTKIRVRRKPDWAHGDWSNAVKVPELGLAIASAGQHVLVINPLSKYIGTITSDQAHTVRMSPDDGDGWLALDHIDDCHLDPARGLVTPTMRRIDKAEAEREAARREAEQRLLQAEQAERARREAKLDRDRLFEERNTQRWNNSPLKAIAQHRWNGHIPAVLADGTGEWWWIHASPTHWHLAIYEKCIHDRAVGDTFTINDCWSALAAEGITTNNDWRNRFKALAAFLEALARCGLTTIHRDPRRRITHISIRSNFHDLEQEQQARAAEAERLRQVRAEHLQRTRASQEAADAEARRLAALRKERQARIEADQSRDWQAQRDRLAEIDRRKAEHEQRWLASDIHAAVLDAHDGQVPNAIKWPGGEHLAAIDAAPAHWHAHIYMAHIAGPPEGTFITPQLALATLTGAGITFTGTPDEVLTAIDAYLYNLKQRGLLKSHAEDDSIYTR